MQIEELKAKIPYGHIKIIAEKAGLTPKSISLFLNGKSKSRKAKMAVLEEVNRLETEEKNIINK